MFVTAVPFIMGAYEWLLAPAAFSDFYLCCLVFLVVAFPGFLPFLLVSFFFAVFAAVFVFIVGVELVSAPFTFF
jgi:hypothetical protein